MLLNSLVTEYFWLSKLKKEKQNQFNHKLIMRLKDEIQMVGKSVVRRKTIIMN